MSEAVAAAAAAPEPTSVLGGGEQQQQQTVTPADQAAADTRAAEKPASTGKWYDDFKSPEVKSWVEKLNLPSAELAAQKAYHLERLLGADKAGRGVLLPKDANDKEGFNAIMDKLGRPAKPEEYQLPVPEGQDGTLAKEFAPVFHELGLTKAQAQGLAAAWNEKMQTLGGQQTQQTQQQIQMEINALKQEWGAEFNAQADLAKRAMKHSGLSDEDGVKLEQAFGVAKAAKMMAAFGKFLAEPRTVRSESSAQTSTFGYTPEMARVRLEELKTDKQWVSKYLGGDKAAMNEMERLQKISLGLS